MNSFVYPVAVSCKVGETVEIRVNNTPLDKMIPAGNSWRLIGVSYQFSAYKSPVLVQVRVNSAQSTNVEGLSSTHHLVGSNVVRGNLKVPTPNLWKEDENRGQDLVNIDAISLSNSFPESTVAGMINIKIQLGKIGFPSDKLHVLHSSPPDLDGSSSGSIVSLV